MERRQLKKQKSRQQGADQADAPKLKYAPPPPPLPPPPAVAAGLPTIKKTEGEGKATERPALDLSEEIVQRRTTLRRVNIEEQKERKKAVQEMNEGELITALRNKLRNI